MLLTRHQTKQGTRWANDGFWLPPDFTLSALFASRRDAMLKTLAMLPRAQAATGEVLAPIEAAQEVWAAGVTYLRSRDARRAESQVADVYDRVYDAARPELFFKALGARVVAPEMPIRIRADSRWNVPEPELVIVVNRHREIVGYCAGNDVSSRDIEGENPLYLPQAKVYNGSCALGHGILLCESDQIGELKISLQVRRNNQVAFEGEATTAQMKRALSELVGYLTRELDFPNGVFLMTGTCVIPGEEFTLQPDDLVHIEVGALAINNRVAG
jgi:2-dehydro-3-deoxy-D-arabinonate dehydratase